MGSEVVWPFVEAEMGSPCDESSMQGVCHLFFTVVPPAVLPISPHVHQKHVLESAVVDTEAAFCM